MAETKADDDDDEGFFGDFTSSSSFPTNPTLRINNHTSTTDDDDWGDFVEYPLQTSGHSHTQAHPNKPVPNQTDQSVSNGVELGKKKNTQWVKPSGALPLSLFGDDDDAVDENKSSVADPSARDNMRNETNVHLGVGINDIFTNLYHQQPQIKAANGFNPQLYESNFNSSSNLSLRTENGLNSDSNKLMSTSASNLGGLTSSFDLGRSLYPDSNVLALAENGLFSNSNQLLSMSSSNLGGLSLDFNELQSSSNGAVVGEEEFDGEDEGWEFKDAFTESNKIMNGKDKEFSEVPMFPSGLSNGSHVELFSVTNGSESHKTEVLSDFEPSIMDQRGVMVQNGLISHAYSQPELKDSENGLKSDSLARSIDSDANFQEFGAAFSKAGSNEKVQEFSEIAMFPTGLQNDSNGPIDLFSASNGFSSKSHEVVDGFDFKPITLDKDGFVSDSYRDSDRMDGETRLTSDPILGSADSDENFGEFETAFPEAESNQKGNETRAEKQRGAVPLSIFGIDEPEVDESKDILHDFTYKPATFRRNTQSHNCPLSINDLLADLYNKAEPITSPGSKARSNEVGLDSADSELNSNIVNGDDDFDDGSWEFKDALSESRAQAQNSHFCDDDDKKNLSPNTELNDFVDFYLKLKDDLCFVARNHLNSLKKAQSAASLSGQDAKVAALDEDIKEACDKLHQENIISKEIHSEDQPSSYVGLKKYLEALHDPKFNGLESEYNLSTRLSLAESDLRSAIELIKHSTTMLKILRLVSVKDRSDYLCTWSKMISVCAQELKHGAWIWNQASEKNLQTRILSEPRGQRYILALGEIYRAAVVLEASAKLYKPWILSGSVDLMGLHALLEECHTLWFMSGLEEALMRMKDIGLAYKDTVKSLLLYIKQIRDLDANGMTDEVSAQQESLCRLSILTPVVVPGTKLVVWNGENYFLVLANLWANLISSDPPKLPCLHVG